MKPLGYDCKLEAIAGRFTKHNITPKAAAGIAAAQRQEQRAMEAEFCASVVVGGPIGLAVVSTDPGFDPEFPVGIGLVASTPKKWTGGRSGTQQKKLQDGTVVYPGWWTVKVDLLEREGLSFRYRRTGDHMELLIGGTRRNGGQVHITDKLEWATLRRSGRRSAGGASAAAPAYPLLLSNASRELIKALVDARS